MRDRLRAERLPKVSVTDLHKNRLNPARPNALLTAVHQRGHADENHRRIGRAVPLGCAVNGLPLAAGPSVLATEANPFLSLSHEVDA